MGGQKAVLPAFCPPTPNPSVSETKGLGHWAAAFFIYFFKSVTLRCKLSDFFRFESSLHFNNLITSMRGGGEHTVSKTMQQLDRLNSTLSYSRHGGSQHAAGYFI